MPHHFRAPKRLDPSLRRQDRDLAIMATQVKDQAMLDELLEGADAATRRSMIERLAPWLPFVPAMPDEACPLCGRPGAGATPHECQ